MKKWPIEADFAAVSVAAENEGIEGAVGEAEGDVEVAEEVAVGAAEVKRERRTGCRSPSSVDWSKMER